MTAPTLRDVVELLRTAPSAAELDAWLARGQEWARQAAETPGSTWADRLAWDRLCLACVQARFAARLAVQPAAEAG